MIYLILSGEGFSEILDIADKATDKLWLNNGIVADDAVNAAIEKGWPIKVFADEINAKSEQSIVKALKYIEKKWPNEDIEVEYL
ncbi:MAG: hypothetical protein HRU20_19080 [Pseudomonadales bacterium]|nr:hypothetical protein [Pseudomonadales bacterium]